MTLRSVTHRLFFLIALNALLYGGLASLYPLGPGLVYPRLTWAQQAVAEHRALAAGSAQLGLYLALFGVYTLAIVGVVSRARASSALAPPALWLIVGGWLICSLVLLGSFPGESADIFDYIFRGRMLSDYGLSPLTHRPVEIDNTPFHRYVSWDDWVDAYGPVWEYASATVAWLVHRVASPAEMLVHINQTCDVQAAVCTLLAKYVTGYRLLATLLTGACGLCIFTIVRHLTHSASRATSALLLWLWNPLVILSTAVGAHNDVLMLVFILLGLLCAARKGWLLAWLLLLVSAHVKITALVLVPVLGLWTAHRIGWRAALRTALMALAITLPISFGLYAPLGGWATLPRNLYERSLESANSVGELLYRALRESVGLVRPEAQRLASRTALIAFLVASTPLVWVAWRRRPGRGGAPEAADYWSHMALLVTSLYLGLGSFWFQAWYLVLPVALVALLGRSRLTSVVSAYCAGALLAAVVSDYLRAGDVFPSWVVSVAIVVLIMLPPVAVSAMTAIRRRSQALLLYRAMSAPSQSSR